MRDLGLHVLLGVHLHERGHELLQQQTAGLRVLLQRPQPHGFRVGFADLLLHRSQCTREILFSQPGNFNPSFQTAEHFVDFASRLLLELLLRGLEFHHLRVERPVAFAHLGFDPPQPHLFLAQLLNEARVEDLAQRRDIAGSGRVPRLRQLGLGDGQGSRRVGQLPVQIGELLGQQRHAIALQKIVGLAVVLEGPLRLLNVCLDLLRMGREPVARLLCLLKPVLETRQEIGFRKSVRGFCRQRRVLGGEDDLDDAGAAKRADLQPPQECVDDVLAGRRVRGGRRRGLPASGLVPVALRPRQQPRHHRQNAAGGLRAQLLYGLQLKLIDHPLREPARHQDLGLAQDHLLVLALAILGSGPVDDEVAVVLEEELGAALVPRRHKEGDACGGSHATHHREQDEGLAPPEQPKEAIQVDAVTLMLSGGERLLARSLLVQRDVHTWLFSTCHSPRFRA